MANRLIVESEMIPRFKEGDIYGGLSNASKVIMGLASKEFTPQQYQEKVAGSGARRREASVCCDPDNYLFYNQYLSWAAAGIIPAEATCRSGSCLEV
ncbi:MAG: hypothetical protein AB2L20_02165 [Mangrovibacterium sp.]